MAAKGISVKTCSVKKYVVRLSGEERRQLEKLIGKGKGAGNASPDCGGPRSPTTVTRASAVGARHKMPNPRLALVSLAERPSATPTR